jgi:hypothetical protein
VNADPFLAPQLNVACCSSARDSGEAPPVGALLAAYVPWAREVPKPPIWAR